MIRRILLTVALALSVVSLDQPASAQGTAAQPQKITFLTNYVFHGRHSPFFVGLEKGFYKEAGFDIQISPATGSGFVVTALDAGRADYGMADPGSLIQQVAKGAKVKAFNVFMDVTTSGLASLKPYPTPQSLAGAKIAASLTDSARVTVPIILQMHKVDPSTIQWQTADPSVYFSLFLSGQVDLFTASIDGDMPAINKVAAPQGKTALFASFADWGYDVFGYFLLTRAERIAEKPAEVKAFSAASVKAVKYAMANPEETARIMVKHNPTLDVDTTLAQWKQSIKAIDTPYMRQNGYGIATADRLQRTIDLTKQALKLEAALAPGDVFAPGFVAK
ncbi:MAG: ABC transporter substrate-binding protein [Proteobacteria bacterium]|nr:ABC transporter substrate-binding protein [Pseudomonadota bacterium]